MATVDSDADSPKLSAHTLSALEQFRQEQQDIQEQFEALQNRAEQDFQQRHITMTLFQEDWQVGSCHSCRAYHPVLAKSILGLFLIMSYSIDMVYIVQ